MLDVSLPAWERAVGACFHYEVMVRILAQKHFAGESIKKDIADKGKGKGKGKGLLTMLFEALSFSQPEQEFLLRCNYPRNKLIHCEPDAVLRVLQQIEPNFKPTDAAFMMKLADEEPDLLGRLQTLSGVVRVQTTSSREEGFVGWMLEAAGNGTFALAAQVFVRAVQVVNSKVDQEPEPAQDPTR